MNKISPLQNKTNRFINYLLEKDFISEKDLNGFKNLTNIFEIEIYKMYKLKESWKKKYFDLFNNNIVRNKK